MYLKGRPLKTKTRLPSRCLLLISLVTVLSACGGGGGGDDSTPSSSTNRAPSVANQTYTVNQAATLTVTAPGVLGNSSDPENDVLTAQVASEPSHGTLTLNANGSFNYAHDGSSSEDDSFTYVASDGVSNSTPATVTINVNGVPVTNSACLPVGTLPGDLNNFVSDDDTLLTFTVQTDPTAGTLTISPDGTVSYMLNAGNEDFRGVDSFTYEVNDNNGGMATGVVNLIVGKTRIMPLGDSITQGIRPNPPPAAACSSIPAAEQIGYRAKLYQDLVNNGYQVDFVGDQTNGQSATPPIGDPDHEGIGGETAADVEARILGDLNNTPADIILLHIGTNGINDDPDDTITDIQQILNLIDTWEGTNNPVTVMLSTIVERSTQPHCDPNPIYPNPNVTALNTRIVDTVINRQSSDDIVLVDQHSVVVAPGDISQDGVHPNATGYEKMADEWFNELTDTNNSGEMVTLLEELKCPVN